MTQDKNVDKLAIVKTGCQIERSSYRPAIEMKNEGLDRKE